MCYCVSMSGIVKLKLSNVDESHPIVLSYRQRPAIRARKIPSAGAMREMFGVRSIHSRSSLWP
jgi:hypothetical protein